MRCIMHTELTLNPIPHVEFQNTEGISNLPS